MVSTRFATHLPVFILTAVFVFLAARSVEAGLKVYYIRHAESGRNVMKQWKKVPKDEWPAYVGDGDAFSPLGEEQQAAVAEKIQKLHPFDFIGVSPMWRARNTVLPYLKETGVKGEIWPELHEFGAGSVMLFPDAPPLSKKILGEGEPIEIPADEAPYFLLREDGKTHFKLPAFAKGNAGKQEKAVATRVILQEAVDLLKERFGGSDQTILLVGHGSSGKSLLKLLTNDNLERFSSLENTGIWMAEELPDGTFDLMIYNDVLQETRPSAVTDSAANHAGF